MFLRIGIAVLPFFLCLLLGTGLIVGTIGIIGAVAPAQAADASQTKGKGLHGQPWAFGTSQSREDALWQRSVNAHDLQDKATPDNPLHKAGALADTPPQGQRKQARGKKDNIGLSWDRQKGGWRSNGSPNTPDEHFPIESEHRVRAFADVPAGDDLHVKMGPEVIVKDGKETPYTGKHNTDPKSAVGMGMQFKLDF